MLVPDRLLVLLGDAEQHADGPHRHLGAEVGDEVESARSDQRVEAAGAELPDLRLDGVHLARGEHPGQQAAVHVVVGGSSKMIEPGRDLEAALDQLEHRAPGRAVGLPVDRGRARRRRSGSARRSRTSRCSRAGRFVAQALPDRIGIGVDARSRRGRSRDRRRRVSSHILLGGHTWSGTGGDRSSPGHGWPMPDRRASTSCPSGSGFMRPTVEKVITSRIKKHFHISGQRAGFPLVLVGGVSVGPVGPEIGRPTGIRRRPATAAERLVRNPALAGVHLRSRSPVGGTGSGSRRRRADIVDVVGQERAVHSAVILQGVL